MKKTQRREKEQINITGENPVYIKFEYDESLESKKNLLSSEMSLLNIMKIISRYNTLRLEELKLKLEMYKTIKDLNASMKKTRDSFPFLKIPERAKRQEIVKRENVGETEIRKKIFDEDLESQLKSIQEKLRLIGR
mgnify:FL=1